MTKIGTFRTDPSEGGDCPRCGQPLPTEYPGALSRSDNVTEVCSACGTDEAMSDTFEGGRMGHLADPQLDWPVSGRHPITEALNSQEAKDALAEAQLRGYADGVIPDGLLDAVVDGRVRARLAEKGLH